MYDLPANPTLADIVRRSVMCHPSLLAADLEGVATQDRAYATKSVGAHPKTLAAILSHANQAETGAKLVRGEHSTTFDETSVADWALVPLGVRIIAANVAAKLQALPRHILTQAATLES